MKPFVLAVFILACGCAFAQGPAPNCPAAAGAPANSPKQLIIGTWKHVELARYQGLRKLDTKPFAGENVLRFNCDGTWSLKGPEFESGGTFNWTGPDQLEQHIVESKLPAQRGKVFPKRIVVDAVRLEMHADIGPQEATGGLPKPKIVKPEDTVHAVTVFARAAGKP